MPTLSLYNASIPSLTRLMDNLEYMLKKGEANAIERNIDPDVFLNARLAPDMFDLKGQVFVATSLAKAFPYRVTLQEPPTYEDTETTFADLYARIAKTKADLAKFSAEDIDGLEDREFSVKLGPMDRDFTGIAYLSGFILPNVLFHSTTAYNIMRHNGVPLGKFDFFGGGA